MFYPKLMIHGLPIINSIDDLALIIRIRKETLERMVWRSDKYYKKFQKQKKTGGFRTISMPSRQLKALQSWILRNILEKLKSNSSSKGFEKGENIRGNASPHLGATHIVKMDIEDFFGTVPAHKVYAIFKLIGYNDLCAAIMTNICTCTGSLPQGAPTSPKLANLICHKLDGRIQCYSKKAGLIYTRYADDMTISGYSERKIMLASKFVNKILTEEGFKLNAKKLCYVGPSRRKNVTGLVISESKVGIGRKYYREMRKQVFELAYGKSTNYPTVIGRMAWIKSVDYENFKRLKTYIDMIKPKATVTQFKNEMDVINKWHNRRST